MPTPELNKSEIKKLQDQRRILSIALMNITDRAVLVGKNYCVPKRPISDAKKIYEEIWRKP